MISSYSFRTWQTDDGLPQNSVYSIAQTRDGYLWIGTGEGLARFDGVRFTALDDSAPAELQHGLIAALCADGDGSLWIGCDGFGVVHWSGGTFSRFSEKDGLVSNRIRCLLEGGDGALWIGTEGGLTRYKDGKFTSFAERNGLAANSVRGLCEDQQGNLRIATLRGLSSLDKEGTIRTFNIRLGTTANALKFVCEDRQGRIWTGGNEGLNCVEGETVTTYGAADGLADNILVAAHEDRRGQLWVGTAHGLSRRVQGRFVPWQAREGGFSDYVYTVFEDREGNVWAGGRDGLYRLDPARFRAYTRQDGLTRNDAMSVCEGPAGEIWIGTWEGGVNQLKDGKITAFGTARGLKDAQVLGLDVGRDGSLWVGLDHGGGLWRVTGDMKSDEWPVTSAAREASASRVTRHASLVARSPALFDAAIRVIREDRAGAVWIGTSMGLNVFKAGKFEGYTTANGLAANTILALCEDEGGAMWIGTGGGLSLCERGKFTRVTAPGGPGTNWVNALYLDRQQTLWVGTRGAGLYRRTPDPGLGASTLSSTLSATLPSTLSGTSSTTLSGNGRDKVADKVDDKVADKVEPMVPGQWSSYTSRQGLFSDEVYEIVEDDYGCLWMSCRKGIFRVSRKQLEELDAGARTNLSCTAFGRADGLPSVQCNGVAKPAGWKSRDGRLWFPTIRGVVVVEPGIKSNEQPPPVLIEEVIANGKWLRSNRLAASSSSSLRVPPGRGAIDIHYTALSLQAPERNRFKFRLEPVDPGWVDAGTRRLASYENIAPGKYRFHVAACNNDGIWNEAGATLALEFVPHSWQTWWFKVLIGVGAGLLLTLLYRLRVARLRAIERLRIQIAANLHDDVGARLTKVAMLTEVVDRETTDASPNKPHIGNISRTVREVIQAMDEIVWTINPKNDSLDHLASYIFQYAQEYFQDTKVSCRLDMPAQLPDRPVSTEVRHNLFMAVKEALNNSLKHAHATEVRVGLGVNDGQMVITVSDNGRGFVVGEAHAKGNGLENMSHRLEQIGGHLVLESEPGKGTSIRMEVRRE